MKRINNLKILKPVRKTLRNSLGLPEAILWNHLKHSKQSRKFRRQHSIGSFVLDFYCPELRLAIELDGLTHDNPDSQIYDKKRTKFLNNLGIKVIRFQNKDILYNLEGALEEIRKNL